MLANALPTGFAKSENPDDTYMVIGHLSDVYDESTGMFCTLDIEVDDGQVVLDGYRLSGEQLDCLLTMLTQAALEMSLLRQSAGRASS